MTDPQAHDKHGYQIQPGDTVSFVYGGSHHSMTVEHLTVDLETLLTKLHGSIPISIPAAATRRHDHTTQDSPQTTTKKGKS